MLRSLRWNPPGRATRGHRKDTFGAALEQAEQLFTAASNVGPASRPLLAFYGISQAGRAVAAAAGNVDNKGYRISGHGIRVANNMEEIGKNARLAELSLVNHDSGAFPQLAGILEAASYFDPTRFGDIWGLLPESLRFPLDQPRNLIPLQVSIASPSIIRTMDAVPIEVHPVPRNLLCLAPDGSVPESLTPEDVAAERARIGNYLGRYPTLGSWRFPESDGDRLKPRFDSDGNALIQIEWVADRRVSGAEEAALREHTVDYRGMVCAFPKIGGSDLAAHPFLIWWSMLYALSMLARYEPRVWVERTSVSESNDAAPIEYLLDRSLAVVPELIHRTIIEVAGKS
ncbi:YaaC family protein [Lentzea californiensis]|uniref:YaaC family protein n=1 Tax=Lentzea californiensis TaxID=438851 RepID=UPI003557EFA0